MAQKIVVVVVDDEPDLLKTLVAILEDEGFQVIGLSHPSLVLTLRSARKPMLFLLDMMLPDMNGIELARRLRAGPFPDIAFLALSASSAMLQLASESRLFAETIQKPFDIEHLLDSVKRHVA